MMFNNQKFLDKKIVVLFNYNFTKKFYINFIYNTINIVVLEYVINKK